MTDHLGEGLVVVKDDYLYLAKFRPDGKSDIENGGVKGAELGAGPFEWEKATFSHDPSLPAICIKLVDGGWSRPMSATMFEAEQ